MPTELRISQSAMGGLMFRGHVTVKTAGGYHLELTHVGHNRDTGAEVFELCAEPLTPSETEELKATIDFDFFNFDFWVDVVDVILPDGSTLTVAVNQLT